MIYIFCCRTLCKWWNVADYNTCNLVNWVICVIVVAKSHHIFSILAPGLVQFFNEIMIDIIIFCAIAGFFCYKLYTSIGKYDERDIHNTGKNHEQKNYFFKPIAHKKPDITKPVQPLTTTDEPSMLKKQNLINEVITALNKNNKKLICDIKPEEAEQFDQFAIRYPSFDLELLISFSSSFFEEFFQAFYSNCLDKMPNSIIIDKPLFDSLKQSSTKYSSQALEKNILYKIEKSQIVGFGYDKINANISLKITALKIFFTQDENGTLTSGSKAVPVRFSSILTFSRMLPKDFKDEQTSHWLLNSIK